MARVVVAVLALVQTATAVDSNVTYTPSLRGLSASASTKLHWKNDVSLCMSMEEDRFSAGQRVVLRKCGEVGAGDARQLFDYKINGVTASQMKLGANRQLCVGIENYESK